MFRLNGLSNTRKRRSSWVLIPPIVALGIVIICFSACQERELVTKDLGGGSLGDWGKGSYYPRFVARVNPCPVEEGSSCAWTLDGLPSSEYTVQVIFEAGPHESGSNVVKKVEWTALNQSGVFVSVELRVPNGGEILSSFSGNLAKDWDSWGSGGQDFFYSPSLKDLLLPEKVEVLVAGSIENPGHLNGELSIRVELHAGGKRI
ncbi:MAG: hypothetical protein K8R59_02510 [Thermoanaerobaculales bacterium]|nr:hypothetical protein [Thermoanaerobaculales bacterium]